MLLCWYSKGTKGGCFYHPNKQKELVSTNVRYLEDEQSTSMKGSSKLELIAKLSSESTPSDPIIE
jgi:hypothetical protein